MYITTTKKPKREKDTNKLAKQIVDIATGETEEEDQQSKDNKINPHAVELGRLGGLVGGKARVKKLSPERRTEIAKKAAQKRWKKNQKAKDK